MCYAAVSGRDSVSSGGFVGRMLIVAIVALSLLVLVSCGPKSQLGQGAKVEIKADNGSTQNVYIGNRTTVTTPTATVTVPASMLGVQ